MMLDKDLTKHAAEFRRALTNLKFDRTEDGGIYFPAARAIARGVYVHDVNGLDVRTDPNILPTEGLNYLLGAGLGATAKISAWYMALFSGAVTPADTLTAATFTSVCTEITSGTEGFTEATRVAFTASTPSGASINNTAAKAAFTIATATALVVNGAAMLSASAKGATTGTIASATRFAAARSLSNTDVFNLGYTVSLTST